MKGTTSVQSCGCCEGIEKLTPMPTANRPGLDALAYRVGTHASFLETMKARLSNLYLEVPSEGDGQGKQKIYPLRALTTRDGGDPSIALLDAWATVADVLTFYQERIANEGYLRTATERRSILELARLVGYRLRPGVAASVYLAFELENGYQVEIPRGTRAQSLPGPGELPQPFETSEPLPARAEWNAIKPRLKRPQRIAFGNFEVIDTLYFEGTSTNLQPNDPLLIVLGRNPGQQVVRWVESIEPQNDEGCTRVTLQPFWTPAARIQAAKQLIKRFLELEEFCVPAEDSLAQETAEILRAFEKALDPQQPKSLENTMSEFGPKLGEKYAAASQQQNTRVLIWLEQFRQAVTDLSERFAAAPLSNAAHSASQPFAFDFNAPAAESAGIAEFSEHGERVQTPLGRLMSLATPLSKPASIQPANAQRLPRVIEKVFDVQADVVPRLLTAVQPALQLALFKALQNIAVSPAPVKVYALRLTASLFGHNAPKEPQYEPILVPSSTGSDRLVRNPNGGNLKPQSEWKEWPPDDDTNTGEAGNKLYLDNAYEQILPGSYIAVKTPDSPTPLVYNNVSVQIRSRNAYSISGKTIVITLPAGSPAWWDPGDDIAPIRGTVVYAQSELLELAQAPITTDVCNDQIELGEVHEGLEAGRWLIVSGERTDVTDADGNTISGVEASELVMLSEVYHHFDSRLPGDHTHTYLRIANKLAYTYKRDTLTIYANVAKATHGETRQEVLGSGDGSKALQQYTLKQSPLTYVAAPTPAGAESTLKIYVNDVRWHEAESLVELRPTDRKYITQTDNEQKTTVIFGDGQRGARLPTGSENIRAKYRSGIGKPGNVAAEQISMLATRPLGVKGVINPRRASGGADLESRDQARSNAPLAVMALDRLVSVQDYADFARTFAGIGKASAVRLTDGRRQLVHVTIAGADDIPIDEESDLYRNLVMALGQHGDPHQPIEVEMRELMVLIISARVRLLPDYLWEAVAPQIRNALQEAFGFERRELGQDVLQSEVISIIQRVPGVAYVDLDVLNSISEAEGKDETLLAEKLEELTGEGAAGTKKRPRPRIPVRMAGQGDGNGIAPAQLAILSPDLPDTLILTEIS